MISYDRYKSRIQKLAAVKNFVVRFRALFIAGFSIIIALIVAFLATKGIVTGDLSLTVTDIRYGDAYDVQPVTALFSSVTYEFSAEDSEDWSVQKPDKAGKYRVRTVTDKAFGVGYGKPLSFEIAPRPTEITITQESVTYGDDPSNFTCPLVGGDKLAVVGFRFDSFEASITTVSANAESVQIVNPQGEDVTYCYALSTPVKEVSLAPKRVSLAPKAAEYTYAGAPLSYESLLDEASLNELATGDTVEIETEIIDASGAAVEAPEFAGEYAVRISAVKIMNGNTDVSALYDWESSAKTAKITVLKRAVTVISADDTKEYDATPLQNSTVTVENLAETDYLSVGLTTSLLNAGSTENHVQAWGLFREGEEFPVHDSYDVTFISGTLTVTPKPITVTTVSDTKDYDGTPLKNEGFGVSPAAVEGHTVSFAGEQAQITKVGTAENRFVVSITDGEGAFVTDNYAIEYNYGTLTVTRKALTYTAETLTKVYDGTPLVAFGTITGGLATGEAYELTADSSSQTAAGDTDNAPVFRTYIVASGEETTENYLPTLEGERGKLVVQKRSVSVTTYSQEFIYNGADQLFPYADIVLTGTEEAGLAPDQTYMAAIGSDAFIREVGSKENKFPLEFSDGEGNNVTENYEISGYTYGTLTVTKRYLHILTGTKVDEEYDGTPFRYTVPASLTPSGDGSEASGLVFVHTLTADTSKEIASVTDVTVGGVENKFSCLVWDETGEDVTDNYTIEYTYGTINRSPRVVKVTTDDWHTEYDGKPMQKLSWTDERVLSDLGHALALDMSREADFGSITYGYDEEGNELSAENTLYFVVMRGEEDISYNYELRVTFGTLTRDRRSMTLTTLSAEKVYDALSLDGADEASGYVTAAPKFERLVEDERYERNSSRTVINVLRDGDEDRTVLAYENDTTYDFFTADGFKSTYNYEITYVYGELLVKPQPLKIRTSTVTREYNGQWLKGTETGEGELGTPSFDGLVSGQTAKAIPENTARIFDVYWGDGENRQVLGIENGTLYKVYISETEETTDNYDITYTKGRLTITPKALTITTPSATKTYDADALDGSVEGDWTNGKPVFEGLISGETYETDVAFTATNVKRASFDETNADYTKILAYDNTTTYKLYTYASGSAIGIAMRSETTDNYTIEYVYGELKIEPREITVTTKGDTREYDGTALTKRAEGDYSADNLVEKYEHFLTLDMSKAELFGTITDVMDGMQGDTNKGVANTLFVRVLQGKADVTDNYAITYEYGTLKVNPREITVSTASAEKEYDGTALIKRDGFTPSWLYTEGNHEVVLDASRENEFASIVNVAEGMTGGVNAGIDNVLYFKVQLKGGIEEQNARVDMNYNISAPKNEDGSAAWGKLKITPKTITVRTGTKHFTYDGAEHLWDEKTDGDGYTVMSCDEQSFLDSALGDTKIKHVLVADASKEFGKVTCVDDNAERNNKQYYFVYPENYGSNTDAENDFINQNYEIEYVYGDLVIDEREITITAISAEKTYDGSALEGDRGYGTSTAPTITWSGDGDAIVSGEQERAIASTITKITDVAFKDGEVTSVENGTQYKIYKGTTDTTNNYKIKLVPGTLKINQRNITLETLTAEKIYDGTPLDGGYGYGDNTAPIITGDLASGEDYEVVKAIGIVNVLWKDDNPATGEIVTESNTTTYKIVKADGTDSTSNYNIEKKYGTLKILQREIQYTTPTDTHEYDGEEFYKYATGYTVDFIDGENKKQEGKGLALANHKLALDPSVTSNYRSITNVLKSGADVLSIDNKVYYIVVDGDGKDITANYNITGRTWGKLTVTPRRLQITTATHEWVYEDNDLSDSSYTALHLVANSITEKDNAFTFVTGHTLQAVTYKEVNTVCEGVDNVCTYKVMNGSEDVSYNYDLTVIAGKLTVTARPITITSGSGSFTYDGQPHSKLTGFTWTELDTENKVGLLTGHEVLVATAAADAPSITHYRDNKAQNNGLTFKIEKNGTDLTKNYSVKTVNGTISVTQAKITIVLNPIEERKYNGNATVYPEGADNYVLASSTALIGNEKLTVAVYFTKDEAGTGDTVTPILSGIYYAHLDYEHCKVSGVSDETGDTDATDYEITAEPVRFVITENGITVETATKSDVYDGDPYFCTEFTEATVNALKAINHTIAWDGDENTRASVTDVKKLVEGKLVDNIVENVFGYVIYNEDGEDVTENFEITKVWGKISVTARPLTVVTASKTHEYDGEAFFWTHWEDNPDGLLTTYNHTLEWDGDEDTAASVTSVYDGEVTNEFVVVVKNASGEDISYNYNIGYQNDGKIKITPRLIEITVNTEHKTYDGTKLVNDGATAKHKTGDREEDATDNEVALIGEGENRDRLVATSAEVSVTNVYDGEVANIYDYVVKNASGDDVSENYQIVQIKAGTLYIDALAVEVLLSELDDTVYGDPVSVYATGTGNYQSLSKSLVTGETLEVKVYYTLGGEKKALSVAGAYQIVLDAENSVICKNGNPTEKGIQNYTLTQKDASEARVEIFKRQIQLAVKQLSNATHIYNGEAFDYTTAFGANETFYTVTTLNGKGGAIPAGEQLAVGLTIIGTNAAHAELRHADTYTLTIDLSECSVSKQAKEGEESEDLSDNYTITATSASATYTVTPKEFSVTLKNDGREYDGTTYAYAFKEPTEADYEIVGLLDGTTLNAQFTYTKGGTEATPKDAGSYTVSMNQTGWSVTSLRDVPCETSDYTLKATAEATITIEKRNITVTVIDWDDEYKADDFSFTDVHYNSSHNGAKEEDDELNKAGFVSGGESGLTDDSGKYSYEYYSGSQKVTPRNVDEYTVKVVFDASLSENYNITPVDGKFTVKPREIVVTGLHESFTYNADKLGTAENGYGFSFTSHKKDSGAAGFLGEDANAYTATYEVYYKKSETEKEAFDYKNNVIHGGDYGIVIGISTTDAEIRKNYNITTEDGGFTVEKRAINATRDDAFEKVYDKQTISMADWNFTDWFGGDREEAGFLLDSERQNATPVYFIRTASDGSANPENPENPDEPSLQSEEGEESVNPIDAGSYIITISRFTSKDGSGLIERDYVVAGGEEDLIIHQFTLILKAKDYEELNVGVEIALPEYSVTAYTINAAGSAYIDCENAADGNDKLCTLTTGDRVTIVGDAVFVPGSGRSQKVGIQSFEIFDESGADMQSNYKVYYNYELLTETEKSDLKKIGISRSFFSGRITCETRTVVVELTIQVPFTDEDGKAQDYTKLSTNGAKQSIPLEAIKLETLTYAQAVAGGASIREAYYGLLTDIGDEKYYDVVMLYSASVPKAPGVYKADEWAKAKVYRFDQDGNTISEVTKGYDVVINETAGSNVTVANISLAFDIKADMGALVTKTGGKLSDGDVAYIENANGEIGELAEKTHYDFAGDGKLIDGHAVEFKAIVEGGKLVGLTPYPYNASSKNHTSREDYYDLDSTVMRYTIYLTAGTNENLVYNGELQKWEKGSASWLPAGYELTSITTSAERRDVGSIPNVIQSYKLSYNGTELTSAEIDAAFVSVSTARGTIAVVQRPVYITKTPSYTFTYNGTAQSHVDGIEVRAADDVSGFVGGHKIIRAKGTEVTVPTASGVKNEIVIDEESLFIAANEASRTNFFKNYQIVYADNADYGYLNVLQRTVTVTVQDAYSKEYDGIPLVLSITPSGVLTDLGHKLEWSALSVTRPSESTSFTFERGTLTIRDEDGVNVTDYYTFDYSGAERKTVTLTVTAKPLTLTSANASKTYDGTSLRGSASVTSGALAAGDTLTVTGSASVTNVGSETYTLGCTVVNAKNEDVTDCYAVTPVAGTLTVTRKEINVTATTLSGVEYGEALTLPAAAVGNYAGLSSALASGETLRVVYYFASDAQGENAVTPKDAGTYYLCISDYEVIGGSAENYAFTYTSSQVIIRQKTVHLQLGTFIKVYDGNPYEYGALELPAYAYEGDILASYTLLYNGAAEAINAGSYTITLGGWRITDGEGNDVSANYNIVAASGNLAIEKNTVQISIGSVTKEYDGAAYEYGTRTLELIDGATLSATVVCTQSGAVTDAIAVGVYGFALQDITVTNGDENNFNFVVMGSLTITEQTEAAQ